MSMSDSTFPTQLEARLGLKINRTRACQTGRPIVVIWSLRNEERKPIIYVISFQIVYLLRHTRSQYINVIDVLFRLTVMAISRFALRGLHGKMTNKSVT